MLIAIDDGHGSQTPGKRTPNFPDGSHMKENVYNEAVAKRLEVHLKRCGFRVLWVAPEQTDIPLTTRVRRANTAKADAYVSIHANAFGNNWNDANGVETWIYRGADAKTQAFAQAVHRAFVQETKRTDRGVKQSDVFYILKHTKMPAVLVEGGFMTNLVEAGLLRTAWYQDVSAVGICKGICRYFGVTYIPEQSEAIEEENDVKRYQTIAELPYGKDVIEKLVKEGVLFGDENGNLNLSEDMLRIFIILSRKNML